MPLASPSNEPKSDERSVASVGDSQAARLYYVQQGREAKGPYRFEVLQDMAAKGLVTAKTYVWHEGASRWVPYEQILQQGNGAVVVANSATDARQQGDGAGAVSESGMDYAAVQVRLRVRQRTHNSREAAHLLSRKV